MTRDRLIYLPLGGAGEIGMNAYVYGYGPPGQERLILVDCGVTFPDMDTSPGIDLIMADVTWLAERADRLEGIFITHGHEDHVGAIGHLWPRLKAPVYARRFTGTLAKMKLEERGLATDAMRIVGPRPEVVQAGPFRVGFHPISHSIPECAMLVIDTPAGRIVHSGDFKLDPDPVVGEAFDEAAMVALAAEAPVRVMTCDSTNVFSTHPGRSEATLKEPIRDLIKASSGMVVATTFASNIARLKTLAEAARAADRSVCLLGRAMKKMVTAAEISGVLPAFPRTITPEEALEIPRQNLMLIVTGSQGERRAATAQLSRGKYLGLEMKDGDTFLFSSKTIPGNERDVYRIMNNFSEMGVTVHDDSGGLYHVSGHPNRPDLETVHRILKPRVLIPMHGEHRHLREHARVGALAGITSAIVANGQMVDITGDTPKIAEYVETGRTYLDGNVLISAMDGVVRDRIRLALNGLAVVTVLVDEDDALLGDAWVELRGLPEQGRTGALADLVEAELTDVLSSAAGKLMRDDDKLEETITRITRQVAMDEIGKKPEVTVVISRLAAE
jgi:ribonuclease J